MSLRNWNLLPGVDPGTWDYVCSKSIADQYDQYFENHPLFAVDNAILNDVFSKPDSAEVIADFGCGTARALLPQVERGYRGVGIDLSWAMLRRVKDSAAQLNLDVECIQANLVQMQAISDDAFDHGICLFSTLGMIKGRENRQTALKEMARVIRPQGQFVLHIHNYWYNLFDPGGPWWLLRNRLQSLWNKDVEAGDKHYPYRGLTNMFLHVFRESEIKHDLSQAGWEVTRWLPLQPTTLQPWDNRGIYKSLKTVGWIIVCQNRIEP